MNFLHCHDLNNFSFIIEQFNSQWINMFYISSVSTKMSERKAVIKNADMPEDMQQEAVECATQALEKYNIEKDIAAYIKKVRTCC